MNKVVGEIIRELRVSHHVSQEKLAEAINSHQVYISEIESGKKLPSLIILQSIASFFGISLTELIHKIENQLCS